MIIVSRRQFLGTMTALGISPMSLFAQPSKRVNPLVKHVRGATYKSRHTCRIEGKGSSVERLEVWLPVPTNWAEQTVSKVLIHPAVDRVTAENGPTTIARWIVPGQRVAKGEPITMVVETEWKRFEIETDLQRLHAQPYRPYDHQSAEYQRYIGSETTVQSTDPQIVEAVQIFKGKDRPWGHIAFDLYSWVLDQTTYKKVDGWKGASFCMKHGFGECGEYSALFVSACRCLGIPARINSGYWAAENDGTHVWAEFMLPDGEWIPVDGSKGDENAQSRKRYFGYLDNNRITMSKTADVKIKPVDNSHHEVDFLQGGAWWWNGGNGNIQTKFQFHGTKSN